MGKFINYIYKEREGGWFDFEFIDNEIQKTGLWCFV